jgi:hypothetical protein
MPTWSIPRIPVFSCAEVFETAADNKSALATAAALALICFYKLLIVIYFCRYFRKQISDIQWSSSIDKSLKKKQTNVNEIELGLRDI